MYTHLKNRMANMYSVVLDKYNIEVLCTLVQAGFESDLVWSKKLLQKDILEELTRLTSIMSVMKQDWAQGSFSTDQMKFICICADLLENDEVRRKFSI